MDKQRGVGGIVYRVLMNGKEVWIKYRIANIESAKATAKIWRSQHYCPKNNVYPKMQVVDNKGNIVYEI